MKINYAKVDDWVNKNDNYSFGGMKLKPMQMAIINCNKSKDVIVNLPTGFGKSLLFQYPASTLYDKTIIVFVPLRALLWDCLKEAKSFKLQASQVNDQLIEQYDRNKLLPNLLFLTPQKYFQNKRSQGFITSLYVKNKIELFVIDEVHCISEWGSDFRPDYEKLCSLRSIYPKVRILGMSATIPPQARNDLVYKMKMIDCYYFQSSSNRTNLIYEIQKCEKNEIPQQIYNYIQRKGLEEQIGIVYCQTIKTADQIYGKLLNMNLNCTLFHSKIPEKARQKVFHQFMNGQTKIIIATICFGMGVNKKNIRFVINVGISLSCQNYYQESGRAGRDGLKSYCLLLTYKSDVNPLQYLINQSTKKKELAKRKLYKLQQLKGYSNCMQCRKHHLFKLLGEDFNPENCKKTCDFCINFDGKGISMSDLFQQIDYTQKVKFILEQISNNKINLTKIQLASILKGKQITNKYVNGKCQNILGYFKSQKPDYIEQIIDSLIEQKILINISQKIKAGKFKRVVTYLKPCNKTQIRKYKKIMVRLKKDQRVKGNVPTNISEHFNKYLTKRLSKENWPNFDDKNEKQVKIVEPEPETQIDLQQVKVISMNDSYNQFFMELFDNKNDRQTEKVGIDQQKYNELGFDDEPDQFELDPQEIKYFTQNQCQLEFSHTNNIQELKYNQKNQKQEKQQRSINKQEEEESDEIDNIIKRVTKERQQKQFIKRKERLKLIDKVQFL